MKKEKRMRKLSLNQALVPLAFSSILVLVACGGGENDAEENTPVAQTPGEANEQPAEGEGATLEGMKGDCANSTDRAACYTLTGENRPPVPTNLNYRVTFVMENGCFGSSAVYGSGNDISRNPGIPTGGIFDALDNDCRYGSQNYPEYSYILYKKVDALNAPNNVKYSAIVFGLYAVKDQSPISTAIKKVGHRQEWEHGVIWLQNDLPYKVGASAHTDLHNKFIAEIPVCHIPGGGTIYPLKYHKGAAQTHVLDFYDSSDKICNDVLKGVKNPRDSALHKLWGTQPENYADYDQATSLFKSTMFPAGIEDAWGETVPRFNDGNSTSYPENKYQTRAYLQSHLPQDLKALGVKFN